MVDEARRVGVSELTMRFGVTDASIRRDLALLENEGRLRRVHGGAVCLSREANGSGFAAKLRLNASTKERIAARAARMVEPGQVVLFDSGTTVAAVAGQIPAGLRTRQAFTVVTYSLPVVTEVGRWDSPHLVCVGGLYLPDYRAFVGPQAIATLRDLAADIAFVGCDGLSPESGLTTPHTLVAEMGTNAVALARTVVVLADSSKIGRRGFLPISPLSDVDVLVTDAGADAGVLDEVRRAGVQVIIA